MQVHRLPQRGETITARSPSTTVAVGGKGANTAVAAARLSSNSSCASQFAASTSFICQFGNDGHARWLSSVLAEHGVDVSGSGHSEELPSGQGMVMLEQDGSVSSVVVGGANTAWDAAALETVRQRARTARILLLQREVPEEVNEVAAQAAHAAGVMVLQDVGGEDRPIADRLLQLITYLIPNESELHRLTGLPTGSDELVTEAARRLQARGAANVLVTLGARGSLLVALDGQVLRQHSCPVPGGVVMDATGAGDAFRAAFAVSLVEGQHTLQESLQFASVVGAIAASRPGAVPSLPSRHEVEELLAAWLAESQLSGSAVTELWLETGSEEALKSLGSTSEPATTTPPPPKAEQQVPASGPVSSPLPGSDSRPQPPPSSVGGACPLKFASRLNSMKERSDLWTGPTNVAGLVLRQGAVRGLDLVDFNYPQHLDGLTHEQVQAALSAAGLAAGAVCIRFPPEMRLGAFTNPDIELRRQAVKIATGGCQWARQLQAQELIVWSAYDGYDYHFQVNYTETWRRVVESFQQVCDACTDLKVSIEFKPTDESSRFSIVPSTGAALLLAHQVNRPNFGLTLDFGHLLMAGENPAQSAAMVAAAGKLYGLQLGDGHSRLGAEDGLMFGSVHPQAALELLHTLQRVGYEGHVYFDTFPRNEDPVREAEYNIRAFKAMWDKAAQLHQAGVQQLLSQHDAMGATELLQAAGVH